MATRFYTDPTNVPSVSPGYESVHISRWNDTTQAVRRKLVIDNPGNNNSTSFTVSETSASTNRVLAVQFVSEPLDANASVGLSVLKGVFRCIENATKSDAEISVFFRKCDQDGLNDELISSTSFLFDGVEFADAVLTSRLCGPSDRANGSISQGQRLIVEVGVGFINTKETEYFGTINVTDNHASDLPENDTETAAYNSWVETGDTFTEASGEPAAIKLGSMFTFA